MISRIPLAVSLLAGMCTAQDQVGAIDFFAYGGIELEVVRTELLLKRGDRWTSQSTDLIERDIERIIGLRPSHVLSICCDNDLRRVVHIGLGDVSFQAGFFNVESTGAAEPSVELVELSQALDAATKAATHIDATRSSRTIRRATRSQTTRQFDH